MPGVRISSGAVVTADIPPYTIVRRTPANHEQGADDQQLPENGSALTGTSAWASRPLPHRLRQG